MGGRVFPRQSNGRCQIRGNTNNNKCGRRDTPTWKCGDAFGRVCATYSGTDISQACYHQAKKEGKINRHIVNRLLKEHCSDSNRSDGCNFARRGLEHVNILVDKMAFYDENLSTISSNCAGNQCKVCYKNRLTQSGAGSERASLGSTVCYKDTTDKSNARALSTLINYGHVYDNLNERERPISNVATDLCPGAQSKIEHLTDEKNKINEQLDAFNQLYEAPRFCAGPTPSAPSRSGSITQ